VSYRLIDHEPEGRTDKVSAMRGHSVAEARLPLLADIVAKVENRTTQKISRKLIFGLLCGCVAL
jgi:Ala-tRNA(Pro) deacylase